MKLPSVQIKPTSRLAAALHIFLRLLLPILILVLVVQRFTLGAVLVVILSKWRIFSVRPRYWLANIKANLVDITVSLSVIAYLDGAASGRGGFLHISLIAWTLLFAVWLVFLKPLSSGLAMASQALLAQAVGISALYAHYSTWNPVYLVVLTWLVCFGAAMHFLTSFEDDVNRSLTHVWALFGAEMSVILNHWIIVYNAVVPQIALILGLVGYALAIGHYTHKTKGLRAGVRQQLVVFTLGIIILVIVFSDWQYKGF